MRTIYTSLLAAGIALAGWAAPAGAGVFSATSNVIAILDGKLFLGEAEGRLSGAGTLAIRSQKDPALTCSGQFTSSAKLGGVGRLQCTDGVTATFHFQRLNVFRGHGLGNMSQGSMSFAYGLSAEEASPYLKLPEGKKLAKSGSELTLVDL